MNVEMKKAEVEEAGRGDGTTLSAGDRQRGAMVAGSTGRRWASTFSRSRDTRTAVSLNAIPLPRDTRSVILLNAKSPRNVEAQLPLQYSQARIEEDSWGPCLAHETVLAIGLLLGYRIAILTPPCSASPWSQGELDRIAHQSSAILRETSLASRGPVSIPPPTRALGHKKRLSPPPAPSRGRGNIAVPALTSLSSSSTIITVIASCQRPCRQSHRSSSLIIPEVGNV